MSVTQLTVLDLSLGVAGPYCARLLADYGAEVVKVEPPAGDPSRQWGPFPNDEPHPERSGLFAFLNANKRGVTLDLETAAGRALLSRLVETADVLVESFEPAYLERLGLAPAALLALNPRLVVTSITPFGQSGPHRDYRVTELVLQALAGWMAGNGDPGQPPLKVPGNLQSGIYAGLFGYLATLGAVRLQRRTGQGQHVDVSALESVLYTLPNITTIYQYSGQNWRRRSNYPPDSPPAGIYRCKDGLVGSSAVYQSEWPSFCALIERPELVDDPRFKTRAERTENAAELNEIISAWMADHTAEEVYRRGQSMKVPIARINTPRDLLESPQLAAREYWAHDEQPGLGPLTFPGAPFKLAAGSWQLRRPAPRPGEHNADVLGPLLQAGSASEARIG